MRPDLAKRFSISAIEAQINVLTRRRKKLTFSVLFSSSGHSSGIGFPSFPFFQFSTILQGSRSKLPCCYVSCYFLFYICCHLIRAHLTSIKGNSSSFHVVSINSRGLSSPKVEQAWGKLIRFIERGSSLIMYA